MNTPVNLLLSYSSQTGIVKSFNAPGANWIIENNLLYQTVETGTKANTSGTYLIIPELNDLSKEIILLNFSPGSVYQSGLVFNHRNEENFCMVLINNYSETYNGFKVIILEVTNGKTNTVHEEKYENEITGDVHFALVREEQDIRILLNNEDVFLWQGMVIVPSSGVGFYTQSNHDSIFKELYIGSAEDIQTTTSGIENNPFEDGVISAEDIILDNPPAIGEIDIKTPFHTFLKIQPPNAQSQIVFREVFNVPLDSFYVSLFEGHTLTALPEKTDNVSETENLTALLEKGEIGNVVLSRNLPYVTATWREGNHLIFNCEIRTGDSSQSYVTEQFVKYTLDLTTGEFIKEEKFDFNENKESIAFASSVNDVNLYRDSYYENLVINTETGEVIALEHLPHNYFFTNLWTAFSEDESKIATYSYGNDEIVLRDVDNNTRRTIAVGRINIRYVNFVCNDEYLLICLNGEKNTVISIHLASSNTVVLAINGTIKEEPQTVSNSLVRIYHDEMISIFDLTTSKRIRQFTGNPKLSHFSHSGRLYADVHNNRVVIFDITDIELSYDLSIDNRIYCCIFLNESELLILTDNGSLKWSFLTTDTTEPVNITTTVQAFGYDYSHDGTKILITLGDDTYVYSIPDLTLIQKISSNFRDRFYFSADDAYIFNKTRSNVLIFKVNDGKIVSISHQGNTVSKFMVCSDDCSKVVFDRPDYSSVIANIYNIRNNQYLHTYHPPFYTNLFINYMSSNGKYLSMTFGTGAVKLGNTSKNSVELFKIPGPFATEAVPSFFNRNEFVCIHNQLYNTGEKTITNTNGTITLLTTNGSLYTTRHNGMIGASTVLQPGNTKLIEAHNQRINYAVLSGNEEKLFTAANDKKICIVDVNTNTLSTVEFDWAILSLQSNYEGTKLVITTLKSGKMVTVVKDLTTNEEVTYDVRLTQAFFARNDEMIVGINSMDFMNNKVHFIKISEPTVKANEDTETLPVTQDKLKFSYLLDFRPRRWYRKFKIADDEEAFQKRLADNMKDIINKLNAVKVLNNATSQEEYLDHDKLSTNLYRISSYRDIYQQAMNTLFRARDIKQSVVHEVRANGYLLLDREDTSLNDTPGTVVSTITYTKDGKSITVDAGLDQSITSKGYEFAIIKGAPDFREHIPFDLMLNLYDFKDYDDWKIFAGDFRTRLFSSGAIAKNQEKLFDAQMEELETFDSNDELRKRKSAAEAQIDDINNRIDQVERAKETIGQDKLKWERDRQKLNSILNGMDFTKSMAQEVTALYHKLNETPFEKFKFRFENFVRKVTERVTETKNYIFFTKTRRYDVVTNYYTYKIRHQFTQFGSHSFGVSYKHTPLFNLFGFLAFTSDYNNSTVNYLHELMYICDYYYRKCDDSLIEADLDIVKINNERLLHVKAIENLEEYGLQQLRHLFVQYWNDPEQFGARPILDNVIAPDSDPLADLISNYLTEETEENNESEEQVTDMEDDKLEIDVFGFQGERYYNQDGLTLSGYLLLAMHSNKQRIALFPGNNIIGQQDPDISIAVVNPTSNETQEFSLPIIKFVETHKILVTWNGYSLGELTHSENLFPNETKEINIERTTHLAIKKEESRLDSSTSTSKQTTSFEEKLENEFSQKDLKEQAEEASYEISDKKTAEQSSTTTNTQSENFSIGASVSGGIGPFSGSVNSNYNKANNKSRTDNKKDAHELSKTNKGKTSSKESRESFRKEVASTIKKAAQETTQENKVEIKVNSSEEYSALDSRKEIIRLENPNVGRTINYNFFQLQNMYQVKTVLTDVKIVIDPNREVIKGSKISDVRVYELEEVGKILADNDNSDPRQILTAAIVARQVFKNYLQGIPGIGRGNGALKIKEPFEPDMDAFKTIFFSNELSKNQLGNTLLTSLSSAMEYMKKVPFIFDEIVINTPETYTVNTGGYFLDSEVGKMTALEDYLEASRKKELSATVVPTVDNQMN